MDIRENLKYTQDHEWINVNGNVGVIGLTDYAQKELGDIVYVDIKPIGTELKKGEVFSTIEAVKTVADCYMPMSGKIIEKNEKLSTNPELINKDPYGEGWIVKIEIKNLQELDELLNAEDYKKLIGL